jgi:hypothetical protein
MLARNHGFAAQELTRIWQMIRRHDQRIMEAWNAVATEALIRDVRVKRSEIVAYLADGRTISVPLAWSWRLSEATPAQRADFRLIGAGQGIHWPEIDEDISVEGMLGGSPAPRPRPRAAHTGEARTRKRGRVNEGSEPTHEAAGLRPRPPLTRNVRRTRGRLDVEA